MPEILTFNTEAEWLAARRKYVTSTEVSAIFGQNPRLTAFELACIKKDQKLDPFVESERTEWGQRLQSAIGTKVGYDYGMSIVAADLQLAVLGSCAASADYRIVSQYGGEYHNPRLRGYFERLGEGLLEIKNVDSLIFKQQWTDNDMPEHIEIQLQSEMLCWDVMWGAVAALVGGNRLELYVRERDKDVCDLIQGGCDSFMMNLSKGILPPPIMPQDAGMVIALNQYAEPGNVVDASVDDELTAFVKEYRALGQLMSNLNEKRETVKAHIFQRIGTAERVINCLNYNISAAMRAPVEVAAHTRAGFRDLRITERKVSGKNPKG